MRRAVLGLQVARRIFCAGRPDESAQRRFFFFFISNSFLRSRYHFVMHDYFLLWFHYIQIMHDDLRNVSVMTIFCNVYI